jgi:hypothetical protein
LKIDCNDYNKTTHSGIDIHAANGVLVDQGSCLFINDVPANNTFSGTCNNSNLAEIYKSSSVPNFSYSYLSSGSFNSTCTNISSAPCTQQNGCPTSITNPVITPKPSVIFAYKSAILQYNEDVAAKSLLIDNGNTQGLLNIIASQNPGNVKNALINASPYLSDEVLIAYLNTNPPHGNMKQIIIANSPVTPTVMNIIDGMNFPNGIRNQINAAQTGISERAKLEASIKYSRTNKLNALDGLIREYLDTNWVDSAVVYLKTEGSLEALCALVPLQIRRDTIDVKNHFTALLAEADLREVKDPNDPSIPEIRGFCDFHLFLMKIVNRPGGYFSMTSSEIAFLKSVANSNLVVAINAQSILNFINHYLPPLVGAYLDEIKSMAILDDNSVATVPQVPFELYPNPTIGVLNISYNFRENEKLLVEVFDITGKLVSTQSLNNSSSIINLSGLNEGLFMVRVYSDGKLISTKKVIYAK